VKPVPLELTQGFGYWYDESGSCWFLPKDIRGCEELT
jgi:hypothetical protein